MKPQKQTVFKMWQPTVLHQVSLWFALFLKHFCGEPMVEKCCKSKSLNGTRSPPELNRDPIANRRLAPGVMVLICQVVCCCGCFGGPKKTNLEEQTGRSKAIQAVFRHVISIYKIYVKIVLMNIFATPAYEDPAPINKGGAAMSMSVSSRRLSKTGK